MAQEIVGEAVILLRTVDQGVESQVKRSVDNAVSKAKGEVKIGADTKDAEEKVGGLRGLISRIRGSAKVDLDTKDAEASAGRLGKALETGTAVAKRQLEQLGVPAKTAASGLGEVEKRALGAGSAMKTALVGGALAAGAAVLAFGALAVSNFLRTAAAVDDLQDVMGGTAESASRLRNIGAALGVDVNTLGSSMFKLSQNMEKQPDLFAKWGVEVAHGRDGATDLYGTLLNLADAYGRIEDPQQRNVFLMETLGKSGKALIDVLAQGSDNLRKFAEAGPILNDADIRKAENFRIALAQAKDAAGTLGTEIGGRTVPYITDLIGAMTLLVRATDGQTKSQSLFSQVLGAAKDVMGGSVFELGRVMIHQKLAGDATLEHGKAQAELKLRVQDAVQKLKDEQDQLDAMADKQLEAISTTVALEHGQRDFERAVEDAAGRQADLNAAIDAYGVGSIQAKEAGDALRDSNLSLKDAALDLAEKTANARANQEELNGAQLTGQDRAAIFKEALLQVAATVEGPLRGQLLELAGQIRTLPDKTVRVDIDDANARAKIAGLRSILFDETITKTIVVDTRFVGNSIAQGAFPLNFGGQQHGGPLIFGRDVMVGEAGPERIRWTDSGPVVEPMGTRAASGASVSIGPNYFGPGSDRQSVAAGLADGAAVLERVLDRLAAGAGTGA